MAYVITVCSVIGTILLILRAYQVIYYLGIFKNTHYKPTENRHKFGICIAGRNEERVIRNLLDSIDRQDYPKDKLVIFVVADNCTDNTAQIVRDFANESEIETHCIEHINPDERTKGFALRYLFNEIISNYGIDYCEGYFIFDADNVLNSDYVQRMNEAFDEGHKIITSFRNTKNTAQNWISFSYAMHWLRTCLFEHRGKNLVGLSCRIQGTGFLFASEVVKDGWIYTSLTEDRAFCSDAVVNGYRVVYCEDAKFYDEQPYSLKVSLRQRLRWAKGNWLASLEYVPKLIPKLFKSKKRVFMTYDCFWLNFPNQLESIGRRLIILICNIIIGIASVNVWGLVSGLLVTFGITLLEMWGGLMLQILFTFIFYHKQLPKINVFKLFYFLICFPIFDVIGAITICIAVFKKVEWKPIPHNYTVDVDKIGQRK